MTTKRGIQSVEPTFQLLARSGGKRPRENRVKKVRIIIRRQRHGWESNVKFDKSFIICKLNVYIHNILYVDKKIYINSLNGDDDMIINNLCTVEFYKELFVQRWMTGFAGLLLNGLEVLYRKLLIDRRPARAVGDFRSGRGLGIPSDAKQWRGDLYFACYGHVTEWSDYTLDIQIHSCCS